MKLLAVLTVFAVASCAVNAEPTKLTPTDKAVIFEHAPECALLEKPSKESIQALQHGQFSGATQNTKCFTNCFLEKGGFMADGKVQRAVVFQKLTPVLGDKVAGLMNDCADFKGVDNCDSAFEIFKCFYIKGEVVY